MASLMTKENEGAKDNKAKDQTSFHQQHYTILPTILPIFTTLGSFKQKSHDKML